MDNNGDHRAGDHAGAPSAVADDEILRRTIQGLLALSLAVTSFSIGSFWLQDGQPWPGREALVLLPGWAAFVASLIAPERLRAIGLIGGLLLASFGMAFEIGFRLPNPFVATFAVAALSSLLLSRRSAWAIWAGTFALWLLCAVWFTTFAAAPELPSFDVTRPANWTRVIAVYAGLSAGLMVAVARLLDRMERSIASNEQLLGDLARQTDERAQVLQAERRLEAQLQQSQKLGTLSALAGGMAHNFSNLLTVILNEAQQLALNAPKPEHRRLAENIVAAAERGGSLSLRLQAFDQRKDDAIVSIDVSRSMRAIVPIVRHLLPANVELKTDLAEDLPSASGPPIAIEQIVLNLCVNARDALPEGGRIRVRTSLASSEDGREHIVLSVQDDGVGMDEVTQARVFEPFFTTKGIGEGTGLGLATVRELATRCGGQIKLASAPGAGSTFEVRLPAERAAPVAISERVPVVAGTGDETVLVVEDDDRVRDIILSTLERSGYTVLRAVDGRDALRAFATSAQSIALVVTDAVMPGMRLESLYAAIKAQRPDLPFLICSGYGPDSLDPSVVGDPLTAFLPKPFTPRELLGKVHELLGHKRARRERLPSIAAGL